MFSVGTVDDSVAGSRRRYYDVERFQGHIDVLFESAPEEKPGPQAILVHQAPGCVLPQHFHMQYQFQVVVGGSGSLGPHRLQPGTVHYASPQAAYGPIVAGPEGLVYATLRLKTEKGAWFMPESRSSMLRGLRKEQVTGDPASAMAAGTACLIVPRTDGLAAWTWRPPAREVSRFEGAAGARARFHVVVDGEFLWNGRILPRHGCVYLEPEDDPVWTFEATQAGSCMLVLQFPHAAFEHDVPPDVLAAAPREHSTATVNGARLKPEAENA
jgi:hypothetical protein